MIDFDQVFTILLGGAFTGVYWAAYAVATVFRAVDRTVLVGFGGIVVFAWTLLAGYTSARTLRGRDDLLRGTIEHVLLWVVVFGAVTIITTWTLEALLSLVWDHGLDTTFWFGMLTVTTILSGILSIVVAGVYTKLTGSTRR